MKELDHRIIKLLDSLQIGQYRHVEYADTIRKSKWLLDIDVCDGESQLLERGVGHVNWCLSSNPSISELQCG